MVKNIIDNKILKWTLCANNLLQLEGRRSGEELFG